MTETQKNECHAIIHSHAAICCGGNLVPIPGVGIAADLVTMTTMACALAGVFGGSITESAGKAIAIAAIKRTVLKQPLKTLTKEAAKIVPILGWIVSATVSVSMIEAAGWAMANELDARFGEKRIGIA